MKKIIVVTLFSVILALSAHRSAFAQNSAVSGPNFESKTHAYQAYIPIDHEEEVSRQTRGLNKDLQIHSYITAEYKSKELGHYIKYSISMEPLKKYKPYQDAVDEKIDEVINFYEAGYEFQIPSISDYSIDGSWGKDITIEFFDGKVPPEKRPKSYKPWVIRRLVFYNNRHVFTLEALGSMAYMYAPTTRAFFDTFTVMPKNF